MIFDWLIDYLIDWLNDFVLLLNYSDRLYLFFCIGFFYNLNCRPTIITKLNYLQLSKTNSPPSEMMVILIKQAFC